MMTSQAIRQVVAETLVMAVFLAIPSSCRNRHRGSNAISERWGNGVPPVPICPAAPLVLLRWVRAEIGLSIAGILAAPSAAGNAFSVGSRNRSVPSLL
jgi:hypothetical protein